MSVTAQEPGAGTPFVLVVDDESGVRDLMSRWLQAGGLEVASVSGAEEALGVMRQARPAVALCDIRMPGRDGLWLADRIRREYPDTAVIMATGVHDIGAAVASLRCGVVDYLTKPFGRDRLRDAVARGLEWHRTARDSRSWRAFLEADFSARRQALGARIATVRVNSEESLERLVALVTRDERDACAHAHRVAALAVSSARGLGMPDGEIAAVRHAALLHDLGKLAMPEAVLRKPAPLTPDEQALIRRHPDTAADLVGGISYLTAAAPVLRAVQERPDGLGYPLGSRGEAVPLPARIVAAAQAYDAMIRPRVFRGPLSAADALGELERHAGTQFDAEVVRVLKRLVTH